VDARIEEVETKTKKRIAQEKTGAEGRITKAEKRAVQEKILIVKNCLALGMNVNTIASATGISLSQIEALRNSVTDQ
jgi:hypothetical protein